MATVPPILKALASQLLAMFFVAGIAKAVGADMSIWLAALMAGAVAAGLGAMLSLERWWLPLQVLFPLALLALLSLDLPPWIYLGFFVLLALIYWSTFRTRVPLYLSNKATWRAVERLIPPPRANGPPLRFIDLGSGLSGMLVYLSQQRPDVEFTGVELAPLPALLARLRLRVQPRSNVTLRWGSFWNDDLSHYDVAFAFLSPVPMSRLWDKLRAEMRQSGLFVSCAFEVPGAPASEVVELGTGRQARLYVWRLTGLVESRV